MDTNVKDAYNYFFVAGMVENLNDTDRTMVHTLFNEINRLEDIITDNDYAL